MAITRGNTQSAENASATSLAVNKPTGLVNGDVIIISACVGVSATITWPSGFTEYKQQANSPPSVGVCYKVVTDAPNEPSTYTVSHNGAATRLTVQSTGYSGVDNVTPTDVAANSATTTTSSPVTVAAITTVTANTMLIGFCGNDSAGTAITPPGTMTEFFESTGTGKRHEVAEEARAATGSTGTRAWTDTAGNLNMTAILGALRPAAQISSGTSSTSFHPGKGPSPMGRFFQTPRDTSITSGPTIIPAGTTGSAPGTSMHPGRGPGSSRFAKGTQGGTQVGNDVVANADVAAGTGIAFDANVDIQVNADIASGTGTALDASVAIQANADVAAGTGTANNANVDIQVNADVAAGTGTALDAQAAIGALADVAAGTGTAYDAFVDRSGDTGSAPGLSSHPGRGPGLWRFNKGTIGSTDTSTAVPTDNAPADVAAGTGTAFDASVAITVSADVAAGTGTANQPVPDVQVNAEGPTGTGTAYDTSVDTAALPGAATGTGTANNPSTDIQVNADVAAGTGTANDAQAAIFALADIASGTGVAFDAIGDHSGDTGSAPGVSSHPGRGPSNFRFRQSPASTFVAPFGSAFADVASGTGTAFDASVDIQVAADFATGSGAANPPVPAISALSEIAVGTGTAFDVATIVPPTAYVGIDSSSTSGAIDSGTGTGSVDTSTNTGAVEGTGRTGAVEGGTNTTGNI